MALKNHKLIGTANVHIPYNWVYADASAREGALGLVSTDEGKFARQSDNDSLWMLVDYSTPGWIEVTGSGGGSGLPSTVVFWARKESAGTINKGQPVYITGYDDVGGYAEVELADADAASKMPAIGLAFEDIDNAATKRVAVFGSVSDVDTSSWSETDSLFVSTTEGALVNTKPTGATTKIQKVGLVLHSGALDGIIQVVGAGRTNDLPNITDGYVWKGDSNGNPQEVSLDTEITGSTHAGRTDNPHSVTKTQVSLGNVTNDAQLKRAAADFASFTEKTAPVDADLVLIEDSEDSNNKKKVQRVNLLPVFGTHYQSAVSEGESSTTSTDYGQKMKMTTPSLPAGNYRIGWTVLVTTSDAAKGIFVQVELDDTTVLSEFFENFNGTYGDGDWYLFSGFKEVALSAAAHEVDIDFKTEISPKTAYVKNARLEIWRVS